MLFLKSINRVDFFPKRDQNKGLKMNRESRIKGGIKLSKIQLKTFVKFLDNFILLIFIRKMIPKWNKNYIPKHLKRIFE